MLSNLELSSLDLSGLAAELEKAREQLQHMRMEHGMRQLKHTHRIRPQKKYIARIRTFMRAIELEHPITTTKKQQTPSSKTKAKSAPTESAVTTEPEPSPKKSPRKEKSSVVAEA